MKRWLRSRKKKADASTANPRGLELLVLEGADTGQKFTIDAEEVVIGRKRDDAPLPGSVLLQDATVSSRQALIRHRRGDYVIVHLSGATNPTRVNGDAIESAILIPGSQIQIGRVVLDVRARDGTGLREFTQIFAPFAPRGDIASHDPSPATVTLELPTTEIRLDDISDVGARETFGWIEVRDPASVDKAVRHPLRGTRTAIGRSPKSDVRIADHGVSRHHAELVWERESLVLYHKSATNPTLVNGEPVSDHAVVGHHDEILLAGRVSLTLDLAGREGRPGDRRFSRVSASSTPFARSERPEPSGLRDVMEQKVALERRIAEDFSVFGSFVDIDVVNSMGMKSHIHEPERIILSFERFRSFVSGIVKEFDGHVLNSNGDELMCFFESSHNAVRAGSAVFARLDDFNRTQNTLDAPFCFRIGVHTGQSLVDLKRGIAYSATLDTAGHLQKVAPTNRMAISAPTMASLPEGLPFKREGMLEREGIDYYLLEGILD